MTTRTFGWMLALAGCVDSATDAAFLGGIEAELVLTVAPVGSGSDISGPIELEPGLRLAIFWHLDALQPDGAPLHLLEQGSTGVPVVDREVRVQLRDPPPAAALVDGAWALGRPVIYLDVDGSGRLDGDEVPLTTIHDRAVLLVLRDLSAAEAPTGRPLTRGLHWQLLPVICDPANTPPRGADDCGVPFGVECTDQPEICGPAICTTLADRAHLPPPPTCILPVGVDAACHPASAGFQPLFDGDPTTITGRYAQACAQDADCFGAPRPRCGPLQGACFNPAFERLLLPRPGSRMLIAPACVEQDSAQAAADWSGPARPPTPMR